MKLNKVSSKMSKNKKGKLSNQKKKNKTKWLLCCTIPLWLWWFRYEKSMIENRKYVKSFIMMLENKNHAQKKRFGFLGPWIWGRERAPIYPPFSAPHVTSKPTLLQMHASLKLPLSGVPNYNNSIPKII